MSKVISDHLVFRYAKVDEAFLLTTIALRSMSYWGYKDNEIEKCADLLTVDEELITTYPVIVVQDHEEVIGFAALKEVEGRPYLRHMWLDPSVIRLGLGRRLFDSILKEARKFHYSEVLINSDSHAEEFFLKLGAKKINELASEYMSKRKTSLLLYKVH